jgi:hypothetical protein
MTPREQALSNVPEAQRWAGAAVQGLNAIIGFGGQRSDIENLPQFKAQKTHFHVELAPSSIVDQLLNMLPFPFTDFFLTNPTLKVLMDIQFKYFDILSALGRASSVFVDAPAGGGAENVGKAPAFVPTIRDGTLRITPYYLACGPLVQVHCLVHESTHFLSDAFQDYAYRDRTGEPDPNRYITLPVQYAIRNADSYAYFALQMAKGIDRVLSPDE